jgi:hypothetical protein
MKNMRILNINCPKVLKEDLHKFTYFLSKSFFKK